MDENTQPTGEEPLVSFENDPDRPIQKALIDEALAIPEECKEVEVRDHRGRFLPGNVANPKGRGKGVRNRMTLARLLVEEALRRKLANKADRLMDKAIQMALDGDEKVMKVLLDKLMVSPKEEDAETEMDRSVTVVIQNATKPDEKKVAGGRARVVIDQKSSSEN